MATPTFPLSLLMPQEMELPHLIAASISTLSAISGIRGDMDISGGGFWRIGYRRIFCVTRDEHRAMQWMTGVLAGNSRKIIVPFLTDWPSPAVLGSNGLPVLSYGGIPHSDDAFFSDDAGYSQDSVIAELGADAAVNAGTITIRVFAGGTLMVGMIFDLRHATKDYRCYQIVDIDSKVDEGVTDLYTVAIVPPLREQALADATVNFTRPRCLMNLLPGSDLGASVVSIWHAEPSFTFVEAF